MNHIEKVREIVKRLWNQVDIKNIDDLVSKNVTIKSPIKTGQGPTVLSEVTSYWRSAFPDLKSEWLSAEEVEPGKVVIKWMTHGTHTGSAFFGIDTSGRSVDYSGETTYIFRDDKLVAYEANVDIECIQQQLSSAH